MKRGDPWRSQVRRQSGELIAADNICHGIRTPHKVPVDITLGFYIQRCTLVYSIYSTLSRTQMIFKYAYT